MIAFLLSFVLPFLFLANAQADTLYLKNGRKVEGFVKSQQGKTIELEVSGGTLLFNKSEVARVDRSTEKEADEIKENWGRQRIQTLRHMEQQKIMETLRPKEIKMIARNQSLLVPVRINDKNATLILDTGAETILLTKKVADSMGIKLTPELPQVRMKLADGSETKGALINLQTVRLDDFEVKDVEAVVLLSDMGGLENIDGLLGMSYLKYFKFTVDHTNKKLFLEKLN